MGDRGAALNHAVDVAFTVGYAAERWGLTAAGQTTDVAGETA